MTLALSHGQSLTLSAPPTVLHFLLTTTLLDH